MQIETSTLFHCDDAADFHAWQDELLQLKAKLDAAERLRMSGQSGFTLEESRRRLAAVCHNDET